MSAWTRVVLMECLRVDWKVESLEKTKGPKKVDW
jgi:hypothetical protein